MPKSPKLAREKEIENQCKELLRIRGAWCQKIHSGEMYVAAGPARYRVKLADKGTPDIMAIFRGIPLGVEVKDSPEEVEEWERQWKAHLDSGDDVRGRVIKASWERSVFQHIEHEKIRKAGGVVLVVSSMEELNRDLDELVFPPSPIEL